METFAMRPSHTATRAAASFATAVVVFSSLPAILGCVPLRPATAPPAAATLSAAEVRSAAEYRSAQAAFLRKDFQGALGGIDALLRRPDLSPDARTYLERQRDICLAAPGGRGPVETASAPAVSPTPKNRAASDADCGPRALLAVCERRGYPLRHRRPLPDLAAVRRLAGTTAEGTTLAGMEKAAKALGFAGARGVQMDGDALARLASPAVAWMDGSHYVAVLAVNARRETATVLDPNHPGKEGESIALRDLLARSGGVLLVLEERETRKIAPSAAPPAP
jgi:hypothetical protein